MERPLSVLLVEDEPTECAAILRYVESLNDVSLVGITNNTTKASEYIKDFLPDALILDLELHKGRGDGITFLKAMRDKPLNHNPYILVTTNNISAITHETVRQLGADYIMVKSQEGYGVESVIGFLQALRTTIQENVRMSQISSEYTETPSVIQQRILRRVITEIDRIGISPKATGRKYLIDAVLLVMNGLNSSICATIAEKYKKSDSSVERAMQNAINNAWRRSDIENLEKYYTARISSARGTPTIMEFVYYYADKIKNEY